MSDFEIWKYKGYQIKKPVRLHDPLLFRRRAWAYEQSAHEHSADKEPDRQSLEERKAETARVIALTRGRTAGHHASTGDRRPDKQEQIVAKYTVIFKCRKIGALGITYRVPFEVEAANPALAVRIARSEAYRTHEHLSGDSEVMLSAEDAKARIRGES